MTTTRSTKNRGEEWKKKKKIKGGGNKRTRKESFTLFVISGMLLPARP